MTQTTISGEVVLSGLFTTGTIKGDEVLKILVVDASLADAPTISLGEAKIPLHEGQTFPIEFQVTYDASHAPPGSNGLLINARIQNPEEKILYVNDTQIPLVDGVQIKVIKV